MPSRKMRVMPAIEVPPDSATVMVPAPGVHPAFKSEGDVDLLCGGCEIVLAESMRDDQLQSMFIRCPECGAMNDVNP